jgi:hypothetical protein
MRAVLLASIAFGLVGSSVEAQDRKGIRFWNLALHTITTFQMSPAGENIWGPGQCKNDRDGTVDHDERLRITGIEPGREKQEFSPDMEIRLRRNRAEFQRPPQGEFRARAARKSDDATEKVQPAGVRWQQGETEESRSTTSATTRPWPATPWTASHRR